MSDRELLELAAKAAGIDAPRYVENGRFSGWEIDEGICFGSGPIPQGLWNPLVDDGDALRLAVKLGLYLEIDRPNTRASALPEDDNMPFQRERFNGDPYAATRRAIVRAAAEIGKTK